MSSSPCLRRGTVLLSFARFLSKNWFQFLKTGGRFFCLLPASCPNRQGDGSSGRQGDGSQTGGRFYCLAGRPQRKEYSRTGKQKKKKKKRGVGGKCFCQKRKPDSRTVPVSCPRVLENQTVEPSPCLLTVSLLSSFQILYKIPNIVIIPDRGTVLLSCRTAATERIIPGQESRRRSVSKTGGRFFCLVPLSSKRSKQK